MRTVFNELILHRCGSEIAAVAAVTVVTVIAAVFLARKILKESNRKDIY